MKTKNIVRVILARMAERGVTTAKLAEDLNLKVVHLYRSLRLNGDRRLKTEEFVVICNYLELTLDDFKE